MSDHLPECDVRIGSVDDCRVCGMLRACEERAGKEAADRVMSMRYRVDAGWQEMKEARAYAAGVQAARRAVVSQCAHTKSPSGGYSCDHDLAVAAIDALLEDK